MPSHVRKPTQTTLREDAATQQYGHANGTFQADRQKGQVPTGKRSASDEEVMAHTREGFEQNRRLMELLAR